MISLIVAGGLLGDLVGFVQGYLDLPDRGASVRLISDWRSRIDITGANWEGLIGVGIGLALGALVADAWQALLGALAGAIGGGVIAGIAVLLFPIIGPYVLITALISFPLIGGVIGFVAGTRRHVGGPMRATPSYRSTGRSMLLGIIGGALLGWILGAWVWVTGGSWFMVFVLSIASAAVGAVLGAVGAGPEGSDEQERETPRRASQG